MENAIVAQNFIDQIWNKRAFEKLKNFLHPDFKDYSLSPMLSPNMAGTKEWIIKTGVSFEHHTIIEHQVTEADNSIIKIRMNLRHIGIWRGIEATGIELYANGYRQFEFKEGKIIAHWALIDGQAIENQLRNSSQGCNIAEKASRTLPLDTIK